MAEKQMYKEEMDRLGFASGGWFKKLAALGSFFGTVADAAPAPPQTAYENLQNQADKKYKDRPADKEMFDVATNYLMEQEDRNIQDAELGDALAGVARNYSNANPDQFKNNYPAKQVKSQWHDIQTSYEIWKTSHIKSQDYYKGEAEKQWEKYELTRKEIDITPYSTEIGSPYHNLQREREHFFDRYIYYIDQVQEESEKIETLKSKPLSERDLKVYVKRLEDTDPEKYAYYQAVIAYNREQVQSRLARKEAAVGPPEPYPKDLIYRDPRLGSVASGNTPEELNPIIVAIDRINQGTEMPDVETRYRGYLPPFNPDTGELLDIQDYTTADRNSQLLIRERESIEKNKKRLAQAIELGYEASVEHWGDRIQKSEENIQKILQEGITYGPLMEDNIYSLLGKRGTIGIFSGADPQRIEYRDISSKTHELLHRYINLTDFGKKEFKGKGGIVKNADSEMFVRAYTAKIRGKSLDDEFFKDLKQTAEGGGYTNLEWDEQEQQYSMTFTDVDQFRKDLPGMIERFEKHVLETEDIHEIYPTAQKRGPLYPEIKDKFAPPSTQPIPVPSLLSRLATGAEYKISEILTGAGRKEIEDLDKRVINYIINSVDQIEDPKQRQLVEKDIRRYKTGTKIPSLTSPFFDVLRHGTLSYEFGNKLLARSALQTKEKLQGKGFFVEGEFYKEGVDPATHKKDALNNLTAFNIKDDNPNLTNEEFNQVVIDRFNESVRKVNNKEKLIPGIDFYLE